MRLRWPNCLPCPIFRSNRYTLDMGLINSETESGLLIQRRRFPHLPAEYTAEWRVDLQNVDLIVAFLNDAAGAEFEMIVRTPGRLAQPPAVNLFRVLQIGSPEKLSPGHYTISARLFLVRSDVPRFDEIPFADADLFPPDTVPAFDLLCDIVNKKLPRAAGFEVMEE